MQTYRKQELAIRAINFDLDTNQMQVLLGSKTKDYSST